MESIHWKVTKYTYKIGTSLTFRTFLDFIDDDFDDDLVETIEEVFDFDNYDDAKAKYDELYKNLHAYNDKKNKKSMIQNIMLEDIDGGWIYEVDEADPEFPLGVKARLLANNFIFEETKMTKRNFDAWFKEQHFYIHLMKENPSTLRAAAWKQVQKMVAKYAV